MNKNLFKGGNVETLFKNSIRHQPKIISAIKEALDIEADAEIVKTYKTGADKGKADVIILFSNNRAIGANVKSYAIGKLAFNQAMRTTYKRFIEVFEVPNDIANILKQSIIRKANNSRKEPLILPKDTEIITAYFTDKAKELIHYSLCSNEEPELFVLWSETENKMSIYLMHNILDIMYNAINVHITKRGVIQFNKYITLQRKGGNGKHDKHKKTDIHHGGNGLQVKIKTDLLAQENLPLCSYFI